MIKRDIIVCIGSLLFLVGFAFYSYHGYQQVMAVEPLEVLKRECPPHTMSDVLAGMTIESLNQEVDLDQYIPLKKRNPFERVTRMVRRTKPSFKLPKPKIEPQKVEPPPVKEEERYMYRGKVVLGDNIRFVIERERDRKTFFVNKDEKTRDFTVLETGDKQVVISDNEGNIKVLKATK